MKKMHLKVTLAFACGLLLISNSTQAYPPFVKQAAKFGAKDCLFCHTKAEGGEGWNKRGEWLMTEKDKRKADAIDVAWLSEFGDKATATAGPAAQANDKWVELEAFHDVMSQTFHPAEEGKFEPIRKRAGELAEKAQQWLDAKPPKIYDTADIKTLLGKLNTESKALAQTIAKGASDEQVKKDLTALHDRFHEIIGACRVEKKKQH